MSKTKKQKQAEERQKSTHLIGNTHPSLNYDIKLIRDSLKTNLYRGCNFLNLTHTQAGKYLERIKDEIELEKQGIDVNSTVTVFEVMIAEAVMQRRWPVIESLLERIMPRSIMPLESANTVLEELTVEQKQNAIAAAEKSLHEEPV